ncbi:MAG: recombinase zinc beta ribbon domain-containing protein [Corynebacterium sp.]|nr:recombinase zinc beta ribbon domain-containing protein [Corynebacterium sp.]
MINSILRNEKYKGDALLQKTFTTDFLTKMVKKNEEEVPKYYVTGHHEPIIESEIWDHVQAEIARRGRSYANPNYVFASMVRCGECGGTFRRKKWHLESKYERIIWRCNNKYEGKCTRCTTPHITEDAIKEAFVDALA